MVDAQAQIVINCRPDDFLEFVLDAHRYSKIDDKIGRISWSRTVGDRTTLKYRPRFPGTRIPELRTTVEMRYEPGARIDVELARLPRNAVNHLLGRYRGSYVCSEHEDGIVVTREVSYEFRRLVRGLVPPRMRRNLRQSLQRELRSAKAVIEGAATVRDVEVVIVGAGLSGVAAAVQLRKAGITDLLIIEKGDRVGGTWRDNTYPGCAVDIPSLVYSFTFAPNSDWTRLFAKQDELLEYVERTVTQWELRSRIRLETELSEAVWDSEARRWQLATTNGQITARHVIFASGLLHQPLLPDVSGIDDFSGEVFHSARWDHAVELAGKRVAVVGTGCSSVQIIPELQPVVDKLYVFQRTPAWVFPRPDAPIPRSLRVLFARIPPILSLARHFATAGLGAAALLMQREYTARMLNPLGRWVLRRAIPDADLRKALTPTFTVGCKRIIMSNTYYPALRAPNVEVIPHALTEVRGDSAVGADGSAREVDVIVLGSGFQLRHPPIAERIRGRDGRLLSECWADQSPRAYRGTTVPNVPNGYFLLGPNIVMYNSLLNLAEWQAGYIADAIRYAAERDVDVLEVSAAAFEHFNRQLQKSVSVSAYNKGGCASFYIDEHGRNFVTYPWSSRTLRRSLRRFDFDNYTADAVAPRRKSNVRLSAKPGAFQT